MDGIRIVCSKKKCNQPMEFYQIFKILISVSGYIAVFVFMCVCVCVYVCRVYWMKNILSRRELVISWLTASSHVESVHHVVSMGTPIFAQQ